MVLLLCQSYQHYRGRGDIRCYNNYNIVMIFIIIIISPGVPYAFSKAGWLLGSFLLLLCGILSAIGLFLLSICAKKVRIVIQLNYFHYYHDKVQTPSSFHAVAEIASSSVFFSSLIGHYYYCCYYYY